MLKSYEELDREFKHYATLTITNGKIVLNPGIVTRIKSLIQWVRDEIRVGRDPSNMAFPLPLEALYIQRYKTHEKYIKDLSTLSDSTKPKDLSTQTMYNDWQPTLVNHLRQIPGLYGIPLSYVVRENDLPDLSPTPNFMEMDIKAAPLNGLAYDADKAQVAIIITNLIVGNNEAETKVQSLADRHNGREIMKALDEHYLGIGLYATKISQAEDIVTNLFYSGE